LPECRLIDGQTRFAIGGLEVQPFPVPHDAREPVQYAFSDGQQCLGVLTDSGSITPHIVEVLGACDGLVLECNHDQALLAASNYPARLKQRIGGRFGHLENDQAADFLRQVDTRRLQHLVAAHLSQENNRPELAARALASALGCSEDWIGVADQEGRLRLAATGLNDASRVPGNEKAGLHAGFFIAWKGQTDYFFIASLAASAAPWRQHQQLPWPCRRRLRQPAWQRFGGFGGIGGRSSSRSSSRSGSRGSRRSGRSSGGRRSGRSSGRLGFFLLATSGNSKSDQRSNEEGVFHNGVPYRQWNDYNEPKV
jgi:hypothetical protein